MELFKKQMQLDWLKHSALGRSQGIFAHATDHDNPNRGIKHLSMSPVE